MKRILFFAESLAGGGAERVLSDIVCNLESSKYDITVYTVTDGGVYQNKVSRVCRYKSFLHIADYKAGGVKKLFYWIKTKLIYRLPAGMVYRWFIKEKFDIEVAFIEGYATRFVAASNNPKSKKIAWVHIDLCKNGEYADKYFVSQDVQKAVYKTFDKVLCVSESVKSAFEKKFYSSPQIKVQYNPVDEMMITEQSNLPVFREYYRKGILLGTVGRLEHQKGYLRLARCAKRLRDEGFLFTIWIIGEGSERTEIEAFIKRNQLQEQIVLLGFQKNPYSYLKKCDAFICSSYAEGFSTAATESLILGIPIFTVDCAGMRELFGNSRCGKIVPNTDEELYGLLKEVVSESVSLEQCRNEARRRGQAFRIKTRIEEIDKIFDEL